MKRSALLAACGMYALSWSPAFGQAQPAHQFTSQQVDRILVLDRLNARGDDTRRLAGVAYSVHNAQLLLTNKANRDAVLQSSTPSAIFDENTQFIEAGPNGTVYPLDQIAARKASQLDGFKFQGSPLEKAADFSVDAIALATSVRSPIAAGTIKLLYPPTKGLVANLVDRDPRSPNLENEFTTEWAAWAYNQVRTGTPAGLALAPYVLKYQGVDPKKDNSLASPVQAAGDRLLMIKTSKTADEAFKKIENVENAQSTLSGDITAIKEHVAKQDQTAAEAAQKAKDLADRVRPVQNIAGSLQLTSYLFEIAGNKDAARTVGGLANAATGVSNLMQTAATAAPMMLAAGYVGVALAVVSVFQSSHEGPSPFPAIFEMLKSISQQIESLRAEISNSIAALDTHLSSMIAQTNVLVDNANYNVQQLRLQVGELRQLLDSYNTANAERIALLVGLIQRGEDRECFQWTGDQKLLPLTRSQFIKCRDLYNDRATEYATSAFSLSSPDSVATSLLPQVVSLFPYAENYETLRSDISASKEDNPNRLANPAVWFRSTTLLLALIQHSPEYLNDAAPFIDGTIQSGEDIKQFINTVAVERVDKGIKLRSERFRNLIEQISNEEQKVLDAVQMQTEHPPIQAPVQEGIGQTPNYDKPYQMLAKKGLIFCKDVRPNLKSVGTITSGISGGGHGSNGSTNQAQINRSRFGGRWDLRATIEAQLRGINYGNLSFDNSLLKSVDPTIVLMEQIKYKNAEMSYCISQFDIDQLDMGGQTKADFTIHIKIYLTLHELQGDTSFLVQELAATQKTVSPWYNYFYADYQGPRPDAIISAPWAQFQGHFDQMFKTVPNSDADQNRKAVRDDLTNFFGQQQASMYDNVLQSTQAEKAELARLKTELLALTQIGLKFYHPAVEKWLRLAIDPANIATVEAATGDVILHGKTVDQARQESRAGADRLRNALDDLAQRDDIGPDDSAISARLDGLRKVTVVAKTFNAAASNGPLKRPAAGGKRSRHAVGMPEAASPLLRNCKFFQNAVSSPKCNSAA